ncbi:MAG: putative transporter permease protein y4fN [Pseudarthrobacter sp.]|nr:putative transporter permease protein y4fN [Pseudarthrobacter sp.]
MVDTLVKTSPRGGSSPKLSRSVRGFRRQFVWIALTAVVAFLVLLPIIPLQARAFETTEINGETVNGFQRFLTSRGLGEVIMNTVWLGLGSVVISMVIGTVLAFCVYMLPARLQSMLAFTPVLPIIIPSVAHVAGFVFLFSPENGYVNTILRMTPFFGDSTSGPINVYTAPWIIIYTGVALSSFVYLFVYSGLQSLGEDYGMAARVNGAGTIRVVLTVTLPMLRPTFLYSGIIVLLMALGQFTAPLMLGRREGIDVLTTRIYQSASEYPIDYPLAGAFGAPLLVAAFFLIYIQKKALGNQKRFVGTGAMSRSRAAVGPLARIGASALVLLFVFLAAVLPVLALIYVALSPFWTGKIMFTHLSLSNIETGLSDPHLVSAITTTIGVTLASLVVVILLGLLIATALVNRDRLWGPIAFILDVSTSLPLAVPAALVGFGFLFAFSVPGLGLLGSWLSLVIAYVTIMIPYSVRYQLTTLIALGQQTTEASRVGGGGPFRTFFQIVLPLARSGLASAAAIMFILLSHEFGVSLLLRGQGNTVLSVLLYDQYSGGSYPMVAVVALVMTAITSLGVIAALIFGGSRALEKM